MKSGINFHLGGMIENDIQIFHVISPARLPSQCYIDPGVKLLISVRLVREGGGGDDNTCGVITTLLATLKLKMIS